MWKGSRQKCDADRPAAGQGESTPDPQMDQLIRPNAEKWNPSCRSMSSPTGLFGLQLGFTGSDANMLKVRGYRKRRWERKWTLLLSVLSERTVPAVCWFNLWSRHLGLAGRINESSFQPFAESSLFFPPFFGGQINETSGFQSQDSKAGILQPFTPALFNLI